MISPKNKQEYCDECWKGFGSAEERVRHGKFVFHADCFVIRLKKLRLHGENRKAAMNHRFAVFSKR